MLGLGREDCWSKWLDKLSMCAFQMRRTSESLDNFPPEFPSQILPYPLLSYRITIPSKWEQTYRVRPCVFQALMACSPKVLGLTAEHRAGPHSPLLEILLCLCPHWSGRRTVFLWLDVLYSSSSHISAKNLQVCAYPALVGSPYLFLTVLGCPFCYTGDLPVSRSLTKAMLAACRLLTWEFHCSAQQMAVA